MNNIPFRGSNRSWAMQGALPTMYQQPSVWDMARKQQGANPWGGSQQAVADPWGIQAGYWGQQQSNPQGGWAQMGGVDPMNPAPNPNRPDNTFQNVRPKGPTIEPFQAQQQVYSSPYNQGYQTALHGYPTSMGGNENWQTMQQNNSAVFGQQSSGDSRLQNTRYGLLGRLGVRR